MAGRGRGRGMVMPAWMKDQSLQGAVAGSSAPPPAPGGFSDPRVDRNADYSNGMNHGRPSGPPSSYQHQAPPSGMQRNFNSRRSPGRSHGGGGGGGGGRRPSHSRDREGGRSRRSRSRSPGYIERMRERRRNRKSNFDVAPPGAPARAVAPTLMQGADMSAQSAIAGVPSVETRHARRMYVGGIEQGVQEQEIGSFFNLVISRALHMPEGSEHVVNVYINHERRFAFVELKGVELTTECMKLDGIHFNGKPLKIRRPNDYKPAMLPSAPTMQGAPSLDLGALGLASGTSAVPDSPHKIFFGGVPNQLTEQQVRELFTAFGEIKAFQLVCDPGSPLSKGYGFLEYMDPSVTDKAVDSLNGVPLADKTLTVRRAVPQTEARAQIAAAGTVNRGLGIPAGDNMGGGNVGGMGSTVIFQPTRILVLANMVMADELQDDAEYADIVDDVRSECAKFGSVLNVKIPRDGPAVGRVFVEFSAAAEASAASATLGGRTFAGRVVVASFYPEADFTADKLT